MRQFRLTSLTACMALALCLTTAIPADAQSHRRGTVQITAVPTDDAPTRTTVQGTE